MQILSNKNRSAQSSAVAASSATGRFAFCSKLLISAPNAYRAGATRSLVNKGTREAAPKEEDSHSIKSGSFIYSLRNASVFAGFETLQNPFSNASLLSTVHDLPANQRLSVRNNLYSLWRIGAGFNYSGSVIALMFSTNFAPYLCSFAPTEGVSKTQKNLAAGAVAGSVSGLVTLPLQMLHREAINLSQVKTETGTVVPAKQSQVISNLYQQYKKSDGKSFAKAGATYYGNLAKVQVPRSIIAFALIQAAFGEDGWFTMDVLAKMGIDSPTPPVTPSRPSISPG